MLVAERKVFRARIKEDRETYMEDEGKKEKMGSYKACHGMLFRSDAVCLSSPTLYISGDNLIHHSRSLAVQSSECICLAALSPRCSACLPRVGTG